MKIKHKLRAHCENMNRVERSSTDCFFYYLCYLISWLIIGKICKYVKCIQYSQFVVRMIHTNNNNNNKPHSSMLIYAYACIST